MKPSAETLIRTAGSADAGALRRLAQRDSARQPEPVALPMGLARQPCGPLPLPELQEVDSVFRVVRNTLRALAAARRRAGGRPCVGVVSRR